MKVTEALRKLVAFTLIRDAGPVTFKKLTESFGDIEAIFKADPAEIRKIKRIPKDLSRELRDPKLLARADEEIRKAEKSGADILTIYDPCYPEELKEIYAPPVLLYTKGKLPPSGAVKVAVVGSRAASLYGARAAKTISRDLSAGGVVVVSGMARGIDSAAHEGALAGNGMTLAVLGGGLSKIYPPENKKLADRIAGQGALISEYPMDMLPLKQHFPLRNRIISGLSQAVLVVEAKEKSGALITVDTALEQGREVFAVPGNIDSPRSDGTNKLLKQGAQLAVSAQDILDSLQVRRKKTTRQAVSGRDERPLDEAESKILAQLETGSLHVDSLIDQSGLKPQEVIAVLARLEIKGFIQQTPGKYFELK